MQIKVVRSLGRPVLWLCGFAQCWVRKFWMLTFSKNASYHRWLFEGVHLEVVTSQNVVLKQQLLQIKHSTWEYVFSMTACVMVLSVFFPTFLHRVCWPLFPKWWPCACLLLANLARFFCRTQVLEAIEEEIEEVTWAFPACKLSR